MVPSHPEMLDELTIPIVYFSPPERGGQLLLTLAHPRQRRAIQELPHVIGVTCFARSGVMARSRLDPSQAYAGGP
jgi:hypothetical protein